MYTLAVFLLCQSQALSPTKTKGTINIPQINENFNVIFLKTTNQSTNVEETNEQTCTYINQCHQIHSQTLKIFIHAFEFNSNIPI